MAFSDYHKVVLFGDSITEMSYEQTRGFAFGAAISDDYRRKLEVVNRGFSYIPVLADPHSGYNTAHALYVLPRIIPAPCESSRIKLMTIFFGANDAVLPGQFQHIPLDRYRENLKKIVNHASLTPHAPKLVLITPAPICEYMAESCDAVKGRFVMQRTAEVTKTYGDACAEVGKELGLPVVNLWEAFVDYAGGWKEGEPLPGSRKCPQNEKLDSLFRDGLHFSPQGYRVMYSEVMRTIKQSYPELDPETLRFVFPYWEEAPKALCVE